MIIDNHSRREVGVNLSSEVAWRYFLTLNKPYAVKVLNFGLWTLDFARAYNGCFGDDCN